MFDFTLQGGNWVGMFIGNSPTFRGDFGDGTDPLGIDPYTQVSRNPAGDKIIFHYTNTDTTGNFGNNDNNFPNLLGRIYNVNTGQISDLVNWTDGDANWDDAAITPTAAPISIDSASGAFVKTPIMVAELQTDGYSATNYWFMQNITYDTTAANQAPSFVTNCAASTLASAPVSNSPDCGTTNGSIMAGASGGQAPYTYAWSTGSADAMISGLGAGTYTVLVTDAAGCTVEQTVLLESNGAGTVATTATDILCAGENSGSAVPVITGGAGPFSFDWSNGETDSIAVALPAGESTVEVTDANGCVSFASVTISEPDGILVTSVVDGVTTCVGDADGEVSVGALGGTGTLMFAWDDPSAQTSATATALPAGVYTVTITDANGCTLDTTATVASATPLTPALSAPVPNGQFTSGVIAVNFDGAGSPGNGPDFSISVRLISVLGSDPDPATALDTTFTSADPNSAELVGVCGGTYEVSVTDAAGCTALDTVTVNADAGFYCDSLTTVSILTNVGLNTLQVYPNPTSGSFQVELATVSSMDVNLSLYNAQGQLIEQRNARSNNTLQTQFDMSGRAQGIYLLRVSTDLGSNTVQVIVR